MKPITLFALVLIALTMSSCRKEWTCECSYSSGGITYTNDMPIAKTTRTQANQICKELESSYSGGCSLK